MLNTFIIQASITIVTYDCQNIFIMQATDVSAVPLLLIFLLCCPELVPHMAGTGELPPETMNWPEIKPKFS
jgi:hypothetical protein